MNIFKKLYHILMGLRYGYPPCCIKFFIENYDCLDEINEMRYGGYWDMIDHIRCEDCWELGI